MWIIRTHRDDIFVCVTEENVKNSVTVGEVTLKGHTYELNTGNSKIRSAFEYLICSHNLERNTPIEISHQDFLAFVNLEVNQKKFSFMYLLGGAKVTIAVTFGQICVVISCTAVSKSQLDFVQIQFCFYSEMSARYIFFYVKQTN